MARLTKQLQQEQLQPQHFQEEYQEDMGPAYPLSEEAITPYNLSVEPIRTIDHPGIRPSKFNRQQSMGQMCGHHQPSCPHYRPEQYSCCQEPMSKPRCMGPSRSELSWNSRQSGYKPYNLPYQHPQRQGFFTNESNCQQQRCAPNYLNQIAGAGGRQPCQHQKPQPYLPYIGQPSSTNTCIPTSSRTTCCHAPSSASGPKCNERSNRYKKPNQKKKLSRQQYKGDEDFFSPYSSTDDEDYHSARTGKSNEPYANYNATGECYKPCETSEPCTSVKASNTLQLTKPPRPCAAPKQYARPVFPRTTSYPTKHGLQPQPTASSKLPKSCGQLDTDDRNSHIVELLQQVMNLIEGDKCPLDECTDLLLGEEECAVCEEMTEGACSKQAEKDDDFEETFIKITFTKVRKNKLVPLDDCDECAAAQLADMEENVTLPLSTLCGALRNEGCGNVADTPCAQIPGMPCNIFITPKIQCNQADFTSMGAGIGIQQQQGMEAHTLQYQQITHFEAEAEATIAMATNQDGAAHYYEENYYKGGVVTEGVVRDQAGGPSQKGCECAYNEEYACESEVGYYGDNEESSPRHNGCEDVFVGDCYSDCDDDVVDCGDKSAFNCGESVYGQPSGECAPISGNVSKNPCGNQSASNCGESIYAQPSGECAPISGNASKDPCGNQSAFNCGESVYTQPSGECAPICGSASKNPCGASSYPTACAESNSVHGQGQCICPTPGNPIICPVHGPIDPCRASPCQEDKNAGFGVCSEIGIADVMSVESWDVCKDQKAKANTMPATTCETCEQTAEQTEAPTAEPRLRVTVISGAEPDDDDGKGASEVGNHDDVGDNGRASRQSSRKSENKRNTYREESGCNGEGEDQPCDTLAKPREKQNDAAVEMKYFIDSIIMDLKTMEMARCQRQMRQSYQCPPPPPRQSLCPPKSFPVTIMEVSPLGACSLYVKWCIQDCYGIGGYEIYVDNYLKNRYYHSYHEAAVVCDVDPKRPHKVVLVATPKRIKEDLPDCCSCPSDSQGVKGVFAGLLNLMRFKPSCQVPKNPGQAVWRPSVYYYDPSKSDDPIPIVEIVP